jgi:hypothetical protein
MRAKTEYVMEEVINNGRKTTMPRKVGLAPVQRDGMEYEFDVVADMDQENNFMVTKSRCFELNSAVIAKPGKELVVTLKNWLTDGAVVETAKIEQIQVVTPSDIIETQQNAPDALVALRNANSEMTSNPETQPAFEFDLNKVVFAVGQVNKASSQERFYTVKKLHEEENAFANVISMDDAVKLVVARLNSHKEKATG